MLLVARRRTHGLPGGHWSGFPISGRRTPSTTASRDPVRIPMGCGEFNCITCQEGANC